MEKVNVTLFGQRAKTPDLGTIKWIPRLHETHWPKKNPSDPWLPGRALPQTAALSLSFWGSPVFQGSFTRLICLCLGHWQWARVRAYTGQQWLLVVFHGPSSVNKNVAMWPRPGLALYPIFLVLGINTWPKVSLSSGSKTKGLTPMHDCDSKEWGPESGTWKWWTGPQELGGQLPALSHWLRGLNSYSSPFDQVSLPSISHSYVSQQIPFSCLS